MSNNITNFSRCQAEEIPEDITYKYYKEVHQANVVDVVKLSWEPWCAITKIDANTYYKNKRVKIDGETIIYVDDSEVYEFMPKDNETGEHMRNRRSLRRIFVTLRQLICTNFVGAQNEQFITLTYEGDKQTNDPKILHKDFKNFWDRLKRRYLGRDLSYISIVEPHASGNWHIHLLVKSNDGEPLIMHGNELYSVWRNGYVTVEDIKSDNIGAYFIAYFTNMELSSPEDIAKYEGEEDIKEKNGKKYIKGKRLDFYPDNMMIYRMSDNILRPSVTHGEPLRSELKQTYASTVKMTTAEGHDLYITTEQHKADK